MKISSYVKLNFQIFLQYFKSSQLCSKFFTWTIHFLSGIALYRSLIYLVAVRMVIFLSYCKTFNSKHVSYNVCLPIKPCGLPITTLGCCGFGWHLSFPVLVRYNHCVFCVLCNDSLLLATYSSGHSVSCHLYYTSFFLNAHIYNVFAHFKHLY